ncbi:PHA/PHB synthase family protein [Rhodococcus opacus]|uniref:PHA/PHB synthase family protein n=1 Tax=Rhodococcus opacus TaxID=37919 RepID=UPI0002A2B370|nr:alpha/beta fold hydrolase [Rhodococcus opacus]ELB91601.1 poly(3-hydroxyalkanoate) polymerase [Rhodococcus wratislaviensis IFP 2016]MDX5968341.1 alpha/beta fold hydrolase [Rhodococcus opacus]NKY76156.1 alpha/beta fold hydrolase [Rhodococcus opacus]QZS53201.1 alpha/beta fold hydrolase [Rhodococcus opacus]RKM73715.1 poly(3-hydroxyalkanoate) polymerase [Rhodococcus opacus]
MTDTIVAATEAEAEELAAPLDLLLTDSVFGIARRMLPHRSWLRLGASLAGAPHFLLGRGRGLAVELADITRGTSTRAPARADQRFADPAWSGNPLLRRIIQTYLAVAETAGKLLVDADLDWRDRERLQFVLDNVVEAAAPSNNPLLNPLGYKAVIDTGGTSVVRGMSNLVRDLATAPRVPTMVDPDAFIVGGTVAATPGSVIFQNRVIEIIQYAPRTPRVREVPLLIVPPVINKFYITDISPGRSMVEYFLGQGQQVFTISWRNPKARHRIWGLDTYGQAIVDALDAVEKITGSTRTHLLGSCSGGMLAAMTAAHLTDIGQRDRLAGLTLAVTVLDQSRAGFAAAALDPTTAKAAIQVSAARGYLDGRSLAEVFAWLRPTDLVWRYWVNNYIQGRTPAPFDVLFWNADTTRMTATLHKDMVQMGLNNALTTPGAVSMLGTPVDLSKVTVDSYVIAGIADHISPWQACYRSARLLGSESIRFVLSTSGHIAAMVNPPGNPRASYRLASPSTAHPAEWLETAEKKPDSWWPDYADWLGERSGPDKTAPTMLGAVDLPPLMPAPGSYVREQ